MNTVKVISSEFDSLKRRVIKLFRLGKSDVQTAIESAPFGMDSNPLKDMIAIYAKTGMKDKSVIVGYINRNQLADVGETRLFSHSGNGELSTYLWLKNDGTMELGGDEKNLARFQELKAGFDDLKSDLNDLKKKWNVFANAYVPGSPTTLGTPPAVSASSESTASIDDAIIEEIKTK